jgi:hypothetical protein
MLAMCSNVLFILLAYIVIFHIVLTIACAGQSLKGLKASVSHILAVLCFAVHRFGFHISPRLLVPNRYPSNLCLSSSWDYRHEPPHAALIFCIESLAFPQARLGPWSSYLCLLNSWYYRCVSTPNLVLDRVLLTFAWTGLELEFSYLCLLSGWGYRPETLCPASLNAIYY